MSQKNTPLRFGLALRAMVLVTIALLPLGLIAVWQTDQIIKDQRETAQRALLAVTEKAAARERRVLERSIGAAAAMGNTARTLRYDPALCRSVLASFERGSALYTFLGFQPASGDASCHTGQPATTQDSQFDRYVAEKRLGLYVQRDPDAPEESILVVATPAFENGDYVGHLRLHIPHAGFETTEALEGPRPLGLVTFNNAGNILTSERAFANARGLLPDDTTLRDTIRDEPYTFTATSENGILRTYAFVPLVSGAAYALGTWNVSTDILQADASYWRTILLAALMWLGSVVVVFLIMQTLVIRGVKKLRDQVRLFRDNRTVPAQANPGHGELLELQADFRAMTQTIIHEEAQLENAVHEKNVLLKEVHHRVKNNLQLINSIINMVLRGNPSAETRTVVTRLQDRVMALASVHRTIYQAEAMDRVDAAEIIREIVNQGVTMGLPRGSDVDVRIDLQPISLYPDQAMPLSLLVSEAITNALKYVGGDAPFISVELSGNASNGADTARLCMTNSVGAAMEEAESTGLGSQLLRAFTHQLEGQATTRNEGGVFTFEVTFEIADFNPDESDAAKAAE